MYVITSYENCNYSNKTNILKYVKISIKLKMCMKQHYSEFGRQFFVYVPIGLNNNLNDYLIPVRCSNFSLISLPFARTHTTLKLLLESYAKEKLLESGSNCIQNVHSLRGF